MSAFKNVFDDVGEDLQKTETLEPTHILSPATGGCRPWRNGECLAVALCLLCAGNHHLCLHLGRSPCWRCPRGLGWQEAWGAYSQLSLTFPSAFSPSLLVTDAICQSPPGGHGESLPRCLSHCSYSHRCWHLVTASPQPDLIGLYMSLPKKTSGDIGGREGDPESPGSLPSIWQEYSHRKSERERLTLRQGKGNREMTKGQGTGSVQVEHRITRVSPSPESIIIWK